MKSCSACGADNDEGAAFCAACGEFLDWDAPPDAPVVSDRRDGPAWSAVGPSATPPPPETITTPPGPPEPALPDPAEPAPPRPAEPEPVEQRPVEPPPAEDAPAEAELDERVRRLVARSQYLPPPAGSPPQAPAHPPQTPQPAAVPDPAASSIAAVISIAERSGRTDLSSRLKASRERLRRSGVAVAVVGEFKKGKTTLVNALLNADVCPAHAVFSTVVPTTVSFGDEILATTIGFNGAAASAIDVDALADAVTEGGNEANQLGLRSADIELPRRLLASGLVLCDTPGVGGLGSAGGSLTMAGLDAADGVLFVTDCTQELTAPELEFLAGAHSRCPRVVCVMTKLDLQPAASRVIERNEAHLLAAGLDDVLVVAVSSVLHLSALATHDEVLEREAGFDRLFEALHQRIWEPVRREEVAETGRELADLADHLSVPVEAQREALGSEEAAQQVITRLEEVRERLARFRSDSARWQQRWNDGIQDLIGDVDHDLRARMRGLSRLSDGRIESESFADDLEFEYWLRKSAMDEVVSHYELMAERARGLAEEAEAHFAVFDRGAAFRIDTTAPSDEIGAVHIAREQSAMPDGPLRRMLTTSQGATSGVVMASTALAFVPLLHWLPVVTLPIAALMGRRAFKDERVRRGAYHRQELKRLSARYLDEVNFLVQKDSKDALRKLNRQLRDHFAERADQLDRTLRQALAAAEATRSTTTDGHPSPPTASCDDRPRGPGADADVDPAAALARVRTTASRLMAVAPSGPR